MHSEYEKKKIPTNEGAGLGEEFLPSQQGVTPCQQAIPFLDFAPT